MSSFKKFIAKHAIPDIAPDIRDEFVVHAATEVQKNARWLFFFLFLTTPLAAFAGNPEVPWLVRWGLPLIMGSFCLLGLAMLSRPIDFSANSKMAAHYVVDSAIGSWFGAVICSFWCVLSWLYAPADDRLQFPIILVMGALATAYCLANIKIGAFGNLVIDLVPISTLLLLSGELLNFAAGTSLILAGLFQWRMIKRHNAHVVSLLELQKENRQLALTDPMTGLLNRRALQDFANALAFDQSPARIILLDVDRFKSINDEFGHDMGDEVLIKIATIIDGYSANNVSAARLGGEEFALLGTQDALPSTVALKVLTSIREADMPHGKQVTVSIGIAEGIMETEDHWQALYSQADKALYEAKNTGRNRYCDANGITAVVTPPDNAKPIDISAAKSAVA